MGDGGVWGSQNEKTPSTSDNAAANRIGRLLTG